MPHVLADQHAHPAEFGVEGPEPLAAGQVALFVEQAVGGEIDLAVQVADRAVFQVEGGIEKAVVVGDLDKADGDGDAAGKLDQPA